MAEIGFIGLGNMGGPMAANLLKAGHKLKVIDVSEQAMARLAGAGAAAVGAASETALGVEAVVTMLPSGQQVREIYLGSAGLIAAAAPGTLFIDCSTIDVTTAREVAAAAAAAGHEMIDAPVSGGTGGAQAGTLTFMVGGSDAAFTQAGAILSCMGKTIVHAGGPGNGQAAKICNNMLLGISMMPFPRPSSWRKSWGSTLKSFSILLQNLPASAGRSQATAPFLAQSRLRRQTATTRRALQRP
jgi:3-hydroxyisobutyrate dehydrogenase